MWWNLTFFYFSTHLSSNSAHIIKIKILAFYINFVNKQHGVNKNQHTLSSKQSK